MGWNDAKKKAEEHSLGGKYVQLQDHGDKVVGVFVGEPEAREVVWDQTKKAYFAIDAEDGKRLVAAKVKPTAKFSFNFYVPKEDMMKIYECGVVTFKDILKCDAKFGLSKKTFEIERNGKKNDSKTTYSVLPDGDITPEIEKKMAVHPLNDLKAEFSGAPEGEGFDNYKGGANGAAPNGDALIDDKTKERLMARLKPMPREKHDKFFARFGVEKLRQLKASDAGAADAFIAELEGKAAPAPEPAAAADPFAD